MKKTSFKFFYGYFPSRSSFMLNNLVLALSKGDSATNAIKPQSDKPHTLKLNYHWCRCSDSCNSYTLHVSPPCFICSVCSVCYVLFCSALFQCVSTCRARGRVGGLVHRLKDTQGCFYTFKPAQHTWAHAKLVGGGHRTMKTHKKQ